MIPKFIAFCETMPDTTYENSLLLPWPTFSSLSREKGEDGYMQF